MAMRPPSLRGQRVREGRGPRSERAMRFRQRHRAEAQTLARFHLSQTADVERTNRRHLRVTAGGLTAVGVMTGLVIFGELAGVAGGFVRELSMPAPVSDSGSARTRAPTGGIGRH